MLDKVVFLGKITFRNHFGDDFEAVCGSMAGSEHPVQHSLIDDYASIVLLLRLFSLCPE